MTSLTLTGWQPGAKVVSAVQALTRLTSLDLAKAKAAIEAVLDGQTVPLVLDSDEAADELHTALRSFGIVAESAPRSAWVLWRQDDNGHRVILERFTDGSLAAAELARFEALSHKQTYWLEQDPAQIPPQ